MLFSCSRQKSDFIFATQKTMALESAYGRAQRIAPGGWRIKQRPSPTCRGRPLSPERSGVGQPVLRMEWRHVKTRHSFAGTEAEEAGLPWRNCGMEAHKGRKRNVSWCGTRWDLFPAVLPASVQPRQACPRSRSGGKGVSYRYGARGGPVAFAKTSWARAPSRRKNAGYVV